MDSQVDACRWGASESPHYSHYIPGQTGAPGANAHSLSSERKTQHGPSPRVGLTLTTDLCSQIPLQPGSCPPTAPSFAVELT